MVGIKYKHLLTQLGLISSVLVVACNSSSGPSTTGSASSSSSQASSTSGKLTIAGSSALQPLMDQAAKNYQMVHKDVQITVSAGGSGQGRNGACQGSLDIGMSDVPLTSQEKTSLNCNDAVETAVAIQAFAVVANPVGPGSIKALTKEQMQNIFSGITKNWSQIGGQNQQIVLVNRLKGSGTRQQMANYLYDGDDTKFATGASEEDNSQTVVNTVAQAPGAISYLGLAYTNNPNLVTMGIQEGSTVLVPNHETVAAGKWPIGGPGLAITKGAASQLEAAFLTYVLSPEFQKDPIWANLGFIPPANAAIGNPTGA
jgi:phosphate transport system substrate-binding protein